MQNNKTETAKSLAALHSNYDPDLLQVIRITDANGEDQPGEPIKLLEVNALSVPAGIVPVYFGVSEMIPYPHVIVEVAPEEYEMMRVNKLPLPDGWRLGEVLFSRSLASAG